MQKLPFVEELGDFLDIDFYQSKESRLKTLEFEKQKSLMQIWNQTASIGPQLVQLKNQSPMHDRKKTRPTPKRGRQPEKSDRTKKGSPKKQESPEQPKKVYRMKGQSDEKKETKTAQKTGGVMSEMMKANPKKEDSDVLIDIP
mmetsp:Transcript_30595/g.46950  ORF Transcript_30595/g.46950 Transcript_30595/m.46950 type:complete len:143 (+) Transcript_30595:1073-1501(+)